MTRTVWKTRAVLRRSVPALLPLVLASCLSAKLAPGVSASDIPFDVPMVVEELQTTPLSQTIFGEESVNESPSVGKMIHYFLQKKLRESNFQITWVRPDEGPYTVLSTTAGYRAPTILSNGRLELTTVLKDANGRQLLTIGIAATFSTTRRIGFEQFESRVAASVAGQLAAVRGKT